MRLHIDERPYKTAAPAVSETGAYCPVSFWQETVDLTPSEALSGDTTCDVAIIGGGFTGLSVAYELKRAKPDLDVVILERGVVGHGASGRNGGFAMPLIGWDLLDAVSKLGEERAAEAYRLMYRAVDHLRNLIERENIGCDLETTGYVLLASSAARERRARKELETAHRLGFEHQWLEGPSLEEHIKCDAFQSGLFDPRPFILNPAKLVHGLKQVVENLGVRIFEESPLEELTDGDPLVFRTPSGAVTAKRGVMALNGYGGALGFKAKTLLPIHTYIVLTEPLSDADLESTGWHRKRAGLETARNFIHYFRLTADNRIAFGGEDAELYSHGAFRDHDPKIYDALEARFREFFPTLAHVNFTHRWGGTLGIALDMFPTFGTEGDQQSIFYAAGYAGHGVSLANYAGVILAPAILESLGAAAPESEATPFFYNRKTFAFPPDPLRYLGVKAYRLGLRMHDKITGA